MILPAWTRVLIGRWIRFYAQKTPSDAYQNELHQGENLFLLICKLYIQTSVLSCSVVEDKKATCLPYLTGHSQALSVQFVKW